MGKADFFRSGSWNFFCDLCGAKTKSDDSMLTWNGLRVCKHHKEVRNPQDFVRGVKDDPSVPWSRPEVQPEDFVMNCTLQGTNAIPGYAIPGCVLPDFINMTFQPSLQVYPGWTINDTSGNTLQDTNGDPLYPPGTPQL